MITRSVKEYVETGKPKLLVAEVGSAPSAKVKAKQGKSQAVRSSLQRFTDACM